MVNTALVELRVMFEGGIIDKIPLIVKIYSGCCGWKRSELVIYSDHSRTVPPPPHCHPHSASIDSSRPRGFLSALPTRRLPGPGWILSTHRGSRRPAEKELLAAEGDGSSLRMRKFPPQWFVVFRQKVQTKEQPPLLLLLRLQDERTSAQAAAPSNYIRWGG